MPRASRRWWRWPASGSAMLRPARRRRTIANAVSPMGRARAMRGTSRDRPTTIFATPRIVMTASATARKWLPASPMNTRAGGRLKTRKPTQQPRRAPLMTMTPVCRSPGRWMRLIAARGQTPDTIGRPEDTTPPHDSDPPCGHPVGPVQEVHRHLHAEDPRDRHRRRQPAELEDAGTMYAGDGDKRDRHAEQRDQHARADLDDQLAAPREVE